MLFCYISWGLIGNQQKESHLKIKTPAESVIYSPYIHIISADSSSQSLYNPYSVAIVTVKTVLSGIMIDALLVQEVVKYVNNKKRVRMLLSLNYHKFGNCH